MGKKNKKSIIIGITTLVLVTLILLGLSYAYYRTRIIGNQNDESISVQSKNMEVTYEDGTASLSTTGKIEPGFTASKTFYVENTGDQSVTYSIMLENINNTFERNQDWTWTLTENGTKIEEGILAVGTHQVLSGSRSIAETTGTKNTYVLTITYENSEENQSEDMGETLSFKVNIAEEQYTWEDAPEGSLLYALRTNQPSGSEETTPGKEASAANEARILTTEDDYGTSYVYRGNVINNYVTYSGMCWEVLRVQGDGTIKLVLVDETQSCSGNVNPKSISRLAAYPSIYNYDPENDSYYYFEDGYGYPLSDTGHVLNAWSEVKLGNMSQQVETDWCIDESINYHKYACFIEYYENEELLADQVQVNNEAECNKLKEEYNAHYGEIIVDDYYGSYARLEAETPTLKCNMKGVDGTKARREQAYVGIVTIDESAFNGYQMDGYTSSLAYIQNSESSPLFWYTAYAANSYVYSDASSDTWASPSIVLKSNVTIEDGGIGTLENAYVIS